MEVQGPLKRIDFYGAEIPRIILDRFLIQIATPHPASKPGDVKYAFPFLRTPTFILVKMVFPLVSIDGEIV